MVLGLVSRASFPRRGAPELCPAPNQKQPGTGLAPGILNCQISTFPSPSTITSAQPVMGERPCTEIIAWEARDGPLGGFLCFCSNIWTVLKENGSV